MSHKHYKLTVDICSEDAKILTAGVDELRELHSGFTIVVTRDDGIEAGPEFTAAMKNIIHNAISACYEIRRREVH